MLRNFCETVFGAVGQVVVGILIIAATLVQTAYVFLMSFPPSNTWIFIVSMEALVFAGYAVVATGLAVLWLDRHTPGVD